MTEDNIADEDTKDMEEEITEEEINLPDADFSVLEEVSDNEELTKLRAENDENREKYIRALAELENFKKRALKEKSDMQKYQGERILLDMLEVLDNLELALQHAEADPTKLKEGLDLIHKRFRDIFAKWDVKGESAIDQVFDPSKHNALSKIPMEGKKAGTVINELKKTYFYKDKLLRPGEVVVADEFKAPEQAPGAAEEVAVSEENE